MDLRRKVPQSHRAEKVLRHRTNCKLIYIYIYIYERHLEPLPTYGHGDPVAVRKPALFRELSSGPLAP